jgi:hypothetical protein
MNYLKINTMKIIATIIHNGISRGIPEGTKVPEKPEEPVDGNIKAHDDYNSDMDKYDRDYDALISVSIEWEDQAGIILFLPNEAFPTHAGAKKNPSVIGGIYPLEGVEAVEILKGGIWVLRLIPQPNSEQKMKDRDYKRDAVSEMLINNLFGGVDEKKEPETFDFVKIRQQLKDMLKATTREQLIEWLEMDKARLGGVSEEEPSQEDLLDEMSIWFANKSQNIEDVYNYLKQYHIQKLKP